MGQSGSKWGTAGQKALLSLLVSPATTPALKLFTDNFRHSVDAKNRLTVPSRWRFPGDEEDSACLMLAHPDGYLMVLPPWRAQILREKLQGSSLFDSSRQNILAAIIGNSSSAFGVDAQGRMTLPEKMKRHAGITKEAVLVGQIDLYKIYSPERWAPIEEMTAGENLRLLMQQVGI